VATAPNGKPSAEWAGSSRRPNPHGADACGEAAYL